MLIILQSATTSESENRFFSPVDITRRSSEANEEPIPSSCFRKETNLNKSIREPKQIPFDGKQQNTSTSEKEDLAKPRETEVAGKSRQKTATIEKFLCQKTAPGKPVVFPYRYLQQAAQKATIGMGNLNELTCPM